MRTNLPINKGGVYERGGTTYYAIKIGKQERHAHELEYFVTGLGRHIGYEGYDLRPTVSSIIIPLKLRGSMRVCHGEWLVYDPELDFFFPVVNRFFKKYFKFISHDVPRRPYKHS